jgi:hypothetical protein
MLSKASYPTELTIDDHARDGDFGTPWIGPFPRLGYAIFDYPKLSDDQDPPYFLTMSLTARSAGSLVRATATGSGLATGPSVIESLARSLNLRERALGSADM